MFAELDTSEVITLRQVRNVYITITVITITILLLLLPTKCHYYYHLIYGTQSIGVLGNNALYQSTYLLLFIYLLTSYLIGKKGTTNLLRNSYVPLFSLLG